MDVKTAAPAYEARAGKRRSVAASQRKRPRTAPRTAGEPARRAARAPRTYRDEEGLRPGHLRRVHGLGRRPARALLPDAGGHLRGPRGHHDRRARRRTTDAAPDAAGVHRRTTRSSAATARPGRSCPPSRSSRRATPPPTTEIAEWMSGNICRCAAYPNIRAAIREVRDARMVRDHATADVRARHRRRRRRSPLVAADPGERVTWPAGRPRST